MPNTSSYVPLMSWYYMGIIGTCVFGTLIATFVLFIHSRKSLMQLPPSGVLNYFLLRRWLWRFILEPPSDLKEIWAEYGLINNIEEDGGEKAVEKTTEEKQFSLPKGKLAARESFTQTKQLVSATKQIAQTASRTVGRERRRRETIDEAADFLSKGVFGHRKAEFHRLQKEIRKGSRIWVAGGGRPSLRFMKRQKMMRRCALEWEFLANCIDRCLLAFFACMTAFFFSLLAFYERWIELGLHFG
uniref:Uncharacterized protein n=1 Tax=Meloidogyne enterolobii TaxID=390850 RepID=A0A6V7V3L8_MELEN|nr:unnamed protein product [Meloidogyne enterolobii]